MAALAALQRGRVSRDQLVAAGLSNSGVYRRVAAGRLHRLHRAVYAVGHPGPVPLGDETAALLACGPRAVLSHLSAGRLWKFVREPAAFVREPAASAPIDVTIAGRHGAHPDGVRVHRASTLKRAQVRIVDGLPVTSPIRTLSDLAAVLAPRELEWSVDEAIQLNLVTPSEVARAAAAAKGRRGAAALAVAAARHVGKGVTRSELERRFRALLADAGLPQPRSNFRLDGYSLDFYWPEHALVVETDGYRFHRTRAKFEHDAAKTSALVAHGLDVMRFTWRGLEERPFVTIAQVAQAIARAESRRAA